MGNVTKRPNNRNNNVNTLNRTMENIRKQINQSVKEFIDFQKALNEFREYPPTNNREQKFKLKMEKAVRNTKEHIKNLNSFYKKLVERQIIARRRNQ
jgi:hypothetical protein